MHFLNATLLAALVPLLLAPVLIHLFNRKFPKNHYFPDIGAIVKSISSRSKLFRWRHLLLAALRTLAILLLLLAFLRPVLAKFGWAPANEGKRHALIVFDHSLSMEHRSGLNTARGEGLLRAGEIIRGLGNGDLLNVIVAGTQPTTAFFNFSDNHTEALTFLDGLGTGLGRADINKANNLAARALTEIDGSTEIYYISDFQRANWGNASFAGIPPESRVFFLPVGGANEPGSQRENTAILSAEYDSGNLLAGEPLEVTVTVGNFANAPLEVELEGVLDGSISYTAPVSAAPWSVATVTLGIIAPPPGIRTMELRIPGDDLEEDNTFHLALGVLDQEEILVVSDADPGQSTRSLFLSTALNPYADGKGSLLPHEKKSFEVTAADLAGPRALMLTGVQDPGSFFWEMTASYLKGGGGVVYFLDSETDKSGLEKLSTALGDKMIPFELIGRQDSSTLPGGALKIGRGDFRSRFLRLFSGENRAALASIDFFDTWRAVPTGDADVLLTFSDGTPAMGVSYPGLGCLVLCNFSVEEVSSNLARQRVFPAWVQELVKNLAAETAREEGYEVGVEIDTEVWASELLDNNYLDPKSDVLKIKRQREGERYRVSFVPQTPGIYQLPKPGSAPRQPPLYAHAVNVAPDEADLRPIALAELPRRADTNPQDGKNAHFLNDTTALKQLRQGIPLFQWFALAALVLLLVEMLFFKAIQRMSR